VPLALQGFKDVRILSELDHHKLHHEEPEAHYSGQCQKVQVANRNQSTNLETDDDDRIRRARMGYKQKRIFVERSALVRDVSIRTRGSEVEELPDYDLNTEL
jgi:hypothetical protein